MTDVPFEIVGVRENKNDKIVIKNHKIKGKPVLSIIVLLLIFGGCLFAELIMTKNPTYMDLLNYNKAPGKEFLFGTDTMGRDIFSMI